MFDSNRTRLFLSAAVTLLAAAAFCTAAEVDKQQIAKEMAAKVMAAQAKVAKLDDLDASRVQIGKVKSFKGKAVILSAAKIRKVTKVGQLLLEGDRVQTENGEVEVEFKDGALLKVNPYSTISVEERSETSGMLLWKKKEDVRRVTCFVGKLWYKSGKSDKKSYVQTPTAVCALRGTTIELGTDGRQSYLDMIAGAAETIGSILRQKCPAFGQQPALQSTVFQMVQAAQTAVNQAEQNPGDLPAQAAARQATTGATQATQQALGNSPDPTVAAYAKAATAALQAQIVAINAAVQVQQAEATLTEALASGTPQEVQAAQDAVIAAAATAELAATSAAQAITALEAGNLGQAMDAASIATQLVVSGAVGVVDDATAEEATTTATEVITYEAQ